MSRIGKKLISCFLICLVVAIATVNTIAMFMSANIIRTIMADQNASSVKDIKASLTDEVFRLRSIFETMDNLGLTLQGNEEDAAIIWELQKSTDSEFAAFCDTAGNMYFKTENFPLADFDPSDGLNGGYMGAVVDSAANLTIQVCKPIERNGETVGTAVIGMLLSENAWIDEIKENTGSEITIFSGDTRLATTLIDENGNRVVGTQMSEKIAKDVLKPEGEYHGEAKLFGQNYYVSYEVMTDIHGDACGAYFSGYSSRRTDLLKINLIIMTIVAALVVAAIATVLIISFNRKYIINPILEANKVADDMSNGNLRANTSNFKFSNDELGDFVRKLEATKSELNNYIGDINYVLSSMATGDFTVQPRVSYLGDFTDIKTAFDKIEASLREIIGHIRQSASDVKNGSEQIAEGSQVLAEGTTEQAAAIEQLSASIQDIADKVQQSAENAAEASKISTQTSDKIIYQDKEIKNMLGAMDEIKEKSDQIQNIIKAIDDIAFQTNILALNAAIEAARAGAAGKGFAVVADEVRNLAAKSAESAQQTGELINATIQAVDKGTVIAQSTAETMKEVTDLSDKTNRYISDISAASEEQAESITQVKIGIERISTVVQQNSATAEQTAASCQELSSQSATLESEVERFRA